MIHGIALSSVLQLMGSLPLENSISETLEVMVSIELLILTGVSLTHMPNPVTKNIDILLGEDCNLLS